MYTHIRVLSAIGGLLLLASVQPALGDVADDQYRLATRHYSLQRWQLSAQEFQTFLRQYPDHDHKKEVLFLLGESLVQLERYDEARALFVEFVELVPEHRFAPQARFRAGETAFLLGNRKVAKIALADFRKRHPQDPLNAYALAYLGQIALDAEDGRGAEAVYRTALKQFQKGPMDVACRYGMAQALELQNKFEEALRFYHFLAEHHSGPLAEEAKVHTGVMHYKIGQYDLAAATLTEVETLFPESDVLVDSLYWLATTRLAQGKAADAVTLLRKARQVDPHHKLADAVLFSLAEAARQLDDASRAVTYYGQLLEMSPPSRWADDAGQILVTMAFEQADYATVHQRTDDFAARFAKSPLLPIVLQTDGRALLKEGQYLAAIKRLEQVVGKGLESGDAEAGSVSRFSDAQQADYYYLGLAYLGAERHQEALEVLQRIDADPHDEELWQGVTVARAFALVAQKKYQEAITPLRSYLAVRPSGLDSADCRAKLVVSLAETGQLENAEQMHVEFQQLNSDHPLFLPTTEYLAQTAHAKGSTDLAKRLYKVLAADGNPSESIARGLAGLGKLQMDAGDEEQSVATFSQLIAQAPQSHQAAEAALIRGKLLQKQQQHDAALATYHLIIDQHPASPQAPFALLSAARLHAQLKQYREALPLVERLLERHPQFSRRDAALYEFAWIQSDLGNAEQADQVFTRLLQEHHDSNYWTDVAYRLAKRAAQTKQYSRASVLLDQLIAKGADDQILVHALYLKGEVAAHQQRWSEVIPPMRQILADFASSDLRAPAEYWVAEAQYRTGRHDEAEANFLRLDGEMQGGEASWLAMISLRRAQLAAHKNDWSGAYRIANDIETRFPEFRQQYEVDYLLGRCLTSQARLAEAREVYERVIRSTTGGRTETAAMAQWMIGETYFHQKEYDSAIRAYYRVESLYGYPRWQAAALLQAGKCHELQGERTLAAGLYAQLLKEHPETTHATEAARRLLIAQQQGTTSAQ